MEPFFPSNVLDTVVLNNGLPPGVPTFSRIFMGGSGAGGFTPSNTIYLRPNLFELFVSGRTLTPSDLAFIGHEITHVSQFWMVEDFRFHYLHQGYHNVTTDPFTAYERISFERTATAMGEIIFRYYSWPPRRRP
jgi:hypothetical protein